MLLKVKSIKIRDVLGVREVEIEPGRVTLIEGKNGSNKTSILTAVQTAIGGGGLAKLSRLDGAVGDTEPEVVLVLDGVGDERYLVERDAKGVQVRARVGNTAAFEDVPKPQTWLAGVFDGHASNPVTFIKAPDKERLGLLLKALVIEFDLAALCASAGIDPTEVPPLPEGAHPLELIELIRESVFRTRTGVNRDQKGKAESAEQLRRNLPAKAETVPAEKLAALEREVEVLAEKVAREEEMADAALTAAELEADRSFKKAEAEVWTDFEAAAAELRAQTEAKISTMRDDVETAITTERRGLKFAKDLARASREDNRKAVHVLRATNAQTREELAALRASSESAVKAEALREQAAQFDEDAERLEAESERLTKALDGIDAYRRKLAAEIPIAGLSVEGKTIKLNNIPLEQQNTAELVRLAVTIACLRAKTQRLPVLFVDGAEALDSANFEALVEELERQGVQAFIAAVRDHELRVTVR